MSLSRRIFVSLPADQWLTKAQNDLKWGIVNKIKEAGYIPEIFTNPMGMPGIASGKAWSRQEVDKVMRKCMGAAIIGMPRWQFAGAGMPDIKLATEYNYYEGAIAYTLGLPMLILAQEDIVRRIVFDQSYGEYMGFFPASGDINWLQTDQFIIPFKYWQTELSKRRDVFLGYCSSSSGTAQNLKRVLQNDMKVSVLDWKMDFAPSHFILQQIEEAAKRCSGGIFLFTKDDKISNGTETLSAVPRDNVVFEAGYFAASKGKENVLIVVEKGAKMPADLGGDIYAMLDDKSNIDPVTGTLQQFLDGL